MTQLQATADESIEQDNFEQNPPSEESIRAAESEKENEIVSLRDTGGQWRLLTGDGYEAQWQKAMDVNDDVFIISVLGNTGAGKSFISQHFFSENEKRPHTVAIENLSGSTTGNVNCFESIQMAEGMGKTLILDSEGGKSASHPLMLRSRRQFVTDRLCSKFDSDERRKLVNECFPKLAYILSNIVIVVGNDEFISNDYIKRCSELAAKANDGVSQVVHPPILIIVQNKCTLRQQLDIDLVTRDCESIHGKSDEMKQLKQYFAEIYCLRLPNTDFANGEKIFREQIVKMKQKFREIYLEQHARLITHIQWLYLLQCVLEIVSSGLSVSIHSLLAATTDTGDEYESVAKKLFIYLYSKNEIHSSTWYQYCREFAMKLLSRSIAMKSFEQKELMSQNVLRDNCKTKLTSLWKNLNELKPCEKLYSGPIKLDSSLTAICYQHKGAHPNHRISGKRRTHVPSVIGFLFPIVWDGNFVSSDNDEPSEQQINNFIMMTMEYTKALQTPVESHYETFKNLLDEYKLDKSIRAFYARICPCCLKERKYIEKFETIAMTVGISTPICKLCDNELTTLSLMSSTSTLQIGGKTTIQ